MVYIRRWNHHTKQDKLLHNLRFHIPNFWWVILMTSIFCSFSQGNPTNLTLKAMKKYTTNFKPVCNIRPGPKLQESHTVFPITVLLHHILTFKMSAFTVLHLHLFSKYWSSNTPVNCCEHSTSYETPLNTFFPTCKTWVQLFIHLRLTFLKNS